MKTEAKVTHTPGPWTFYAKLSGSENHRGFKLVSLEFVIGDIVPFDEDGIQGKANAQIIAAAPDMLEALELEQFVEELKATHDPRDIIRLLESRGDYETGHLSTEKMLEAYVVKAALSRQSAIAKAKGGAE